MPIYEFKCQACHKISEVVSSVDSRPSTINCACGEIAERIISFKGAFHIDQGRHYSPAFGKEFKNERELNAYAKDNGFIPVGDEKVETVHSWGQNKEEQLRQERLNNLAEEVSWETYGGS